MKPQVSNTGSREYKFVTYSFLNEEHIDELYGDGKQCQWFEQQQMAGLVFFSSSPLFFLLVDAVRSLVGGRRTTCTKQFELVSCAVRP